VRKERFRTGRHYGLTMEPRGVMATWDDANGKLTIYGAAKVPFFNRRILSAQIGLPVEQIEMIENDVGGGYGARGEFYPEDFLIPFAARHVNRPVKWIEDRRENLMAMNHARESEADLEIACARDGTILALRGEVHTDMGAYMRTNGAVGARNVVQFLAGPYRVPHVKLDSLLWMTNKTPVGTYRGPGRFEANFFLERMIDMIAADLGIDRIDLRKRNMIRKSDLPFKAASDMTYDCGDFLGVLKRALELADYASFKKRKRESKKRGLLRGFGIGCYLEVTAAPGKELGAIHFEADGTVTIISGTLDFGMGHATTYAQILSDLLGVPFDLIRMVEGDSDRMAFGGGALLVLAMVPLVLGTAFGRRDPGRT